MSSSVRRNPNPVCMYFRRRRFCSQLEVELSGFAHLRLGIEDRCLDRSINNETDSISANRQAIRDVMPAVIGFNILSKTFCLNPDIGTFNWTPGRVLHNPFKSRSTSPDTECCQEQPNETNAK